MTQHATRKARMLGAMLLLLALGIFVPVARASSGRLLAVQEPASENRGVTGAPSSAERRPTQVDSGAAENENNQYRHSASVQAVARMLHVSVETAAVLFEIVNFIILAIGIAWFLLRALPAAFRTRNQKIADELTSARTATEDANERLKQVEDRLARMDEDIARLRSEAEAGAERDHARLDQSAAEEKARIIAGSKEEIAAATEHAQRELKQYAATLAVERAARDLRLSPDEDRALVESFTAAMGSTRGSRN